MKQMLAAKKAPVEKVNCAPKLQKWEAVQNALGSPIANALELMIANCANGTQQS